MHKVWMVRFHSISNARPDDTPFRITEDKGRIVTIEEVEDEDAPVSAAKKKKKKKPKKKKKSASVPEEGDVPDTGSPPPSSPIIDSAAPVVSSPQPIVQSLPTSMPASPAKKKKPERRQTPSRSSSLASGTSTFYASMSTTLLEQTRAQSAHSYLQSENLAEQKVKVKVKTRAESDTKKGFFSRFSRKKDVEAPVPEEETKEKRNLSAWFKNMNRKSVGFMAQILGVNKSAKKGGPPMKWDHFVKVSQIFLFNFPWVGIEKGFGMTQVMIDMGFEVDASTAGSSVRFQPPDPAVRSISFHKRKCSAAVSILDYPGYSECSPSGEHH
jgi:hypothetical protein